MNKCTLLIDGGWLLMSRFSVLTKEFKKDLPEIAKEQGKQDLKELLARSINTLLNRLPMIDNIVLTTEGGSWRKSLPIPKSLEDTVYKGNRSTDSELDWSYIYGAFNDLAKQCKELGITTSTYQNVEGDDWIWYWTRKLNSQGIDCIIWSSDNDLKQLVQIDDNTKAFSAWYNDKNGLWLPNSIDNDGNNDNDIEFFFSKPMYSSSVLESLKVKVKNINYVDPYDIILEKVICGDAGDNIQSILKYTKNGRNYKISVKDWNTIKVKLNIFDIDDLKSNKHKLAKELLQNKKYKQTTMTEEELVEMIDYNIKLVWLNENVIPETITSAMNQVEYKKFDLNYIKSNFRTLIANDHSDIEDIFESI